MFLPFEASQASRQPAAKGGISMIVKRNQTIAISF
jgi:hypothetical protein